MCPGIICLFHTTHLFFFVIENPAHIVGPILVSNNDLIHWYHWFRLKQEGLIYYQSAFIGLENWKHLLCCCWDSEIPSYNIFKCRYCWRCELVQVTASISSLGGFTQIIAAEWKTAKQTQRHSLFIHEMNNVKIVNFWPVISKTEED